MGTAVMLIGIVLMVVIHEGAHFLAAKAFGMKATEAFFGFGPRIWSMTRGETEYGIKAIPLGGYVRIIGMNPLEEIDTEDEARTYRTAVFWKKSVVVLAGIFSHFVMATLLLVAVFAIWGGVATDEAGDRIPTLTLSAVAPTTPSGETSPATAAGFDDKDLLRTYDGVALRSWDDFVERVRSDGGEAVLIGYDRDGVTVEARTTLAFADMPVIVDGVIVTDENGDDVTEVVGYFGAAPEIVREQLGVIGVLDAALRGADTCTRSQTMAQVKWCDLSLDPEDPVQNWPIGQASQTLTIRAGSTLPDPCDPCADEFALQDKVGNYLFRTEIHRVEFDATGPSLDVSSTALTRKKHSLACVEEAASHSVFCFGGSEHTVLYDDVLEFKP